MFISDETIRIIHLVARHQNITTAAEQLNKVPSTISYTLKKAEETLGVELFIRKGRYIELSPAGSYFIEHSKNILRDLDALKRNTVLIHDGIERELTIAVNNIIPGDFRFNVFQQLAIAIGRHVSGEKTTDINRFC